MALQSANKIAWRYTDDAGTNWVMTGTYAIITQGGAGTEKVGGQAPAGTENPWPRSWRPRKVYMASGLIRRAQVAYTTTAPIWVTPGTTLTLNNGADVATFTAQATHLGERKRAATASAS